jgi:hypothetical protein
VKVIIDPWFQLLCAAANFDAVWNLHFDMCSAVSACLNSGRGLHTNYSVRLATQGN